MKKFTKFLSFVAAAGIIYAGANGLAAKVQEAAVTPINNTNSIVTTVDSEATTTTMKTEVEKVVDESLQQTTKPVSTNTTKPQQAVGTNSSASKVEVRGTKVNYNIVNNRISDIGIGVEETSTVSQDSSVCYMSDFKGSPIDTSKFQRRANLSKEQQAMYDKLLKACENGDSRVTFDKAYSEDIINEVVCAVELECPYLTWVSSYYYYYASEGGYKGVSIEYFKNLVSDKEATLNEINDAINPLLVATSKLNNDQDKVKLVHDWMLQNIADGFEGSSMEDTTHTVYGALVEGKAVCEGYCKSFAYIMQKLNIPVEIVNGTTWSGEAHSWLMVQVDNEWYELDVFWDDVYTKNEMDYSYTFFMHTTDSLSKKDTYNGVSRKRYTNDASDKLAEAKGTKYGGTMYDYAYGSDFSNFEKVEKGKTHLVHYNENGAVSGQVDTSVVKHVQKITDLPKGWYKASCISKTGKDSLGKKDWTQNGDFYYIAQQNNNNYYVYDAEYDNYYECSKRMSDGGWNLKCYNYDTNTWVVLK